MSNTITTYNNILIELAKAVKMHNFYPEGHPNLDLSMNKCFTLIKNTIEESGDIHWDVYTKGFYSEKTPLCPGNDEVLTLAKKCYQRRIKEFTITTYIVPNDFKILFTAVRLEPDDIESEGGIEKYFAANNITGILLNEMKFDDLMRLKKELKELEDKNVVEEQDISTSAPGESASTAEEEPEEKAPEEKEKLEDLLDKVRDEKDEMRYRDLAVRIREALQVPIAGRDQEAIYPALYIYVEHVRPAYASAEINAIARDMLIFICAPDVFQYLVERLKNKAEKHRHHIEEILLIAGNDDAINILINELISSQDAIARRNLFNTLVKFGQRCVPNVEARLASSEWYIVRQMVSLLGEIGDASSVDSIVSAYSHPDLRVKKEVLKSLVRIQSPKSSALLISALDEQDQTLQCQAIMSLGILKDPSAIDALGKIALKREHFTENIDPGKEAIKALGSIRDGRAMPYLTKLVSRKVWFGKRANDELRMAAANALGMLGNKEAYEAIAEALKDSSGEMYMVCKKILQSREKTA